MNLFAIGPVPGPTTLALVLGSAVLVALITGLVLNTRAYRRPGTNRHGASAAIYAILAGLTLVVGTALQQFQVLRSPFIFVGPLALLLLIIGEFAAANCLTETSKFHLRWNRGRRRAIAVLIVPVALALIIVAGVVAHSSGHPIFGALLNATAGESVVDKVRNFSIDAPPPWVKTDAQRVDATACLTFARQGPPMVATISVQPLPAESEQPFDSAISALKSQILRLQDGEVFTVTSERENGLGGVRIESGFGPPSDRHFQVHYLVQDGRSFYQVSTRGREDARDAVLVEARKLAAGFRLLDPNPVVKPKVAPVAVTFESTRFGYSVDVTKTVWDREWPALAKEMPFAEFGVLNTRNSAAFCVIPVWLGDDDLDLDLVTQALVARLGLVFDRATAISLHSIRQGPLRGQSFAMESTQGDARLLYHLRVVRGRGLAYLLATWMNKAIEASPEFLELALNCVSFRETVPEPAILSERPRTTHSLVWNDVGTGLFRAGKFDAALPWFKRAFDLVDTNISALANYAETCMQLKRPVEAVTILDQNIGRFPGNQPLAARRAAAMFQAGDVNGAIKGYTAAFGSGWRDDAEFSRYLSIYVSQQRFADATAALERYAAGHDSAELQQFRKQLADLARAASAPKNAR